MPIVQWRMMSVLEKIDLSDNRSLRQKTLAALADEFSGAEAGEDLEVMNEVRLIEVAARCCNIRPVWRRTPLTQFSRVLKTLHTSELLWCDTDLFREDVDKMALAQPKLPGKLSSGRFARITFEYIQSGSNRSVFFRRVPQTSNERLFQNAEARGGIRSRMELFAHILRRFFPNYFHINMRIREFTCRNTEKAKRTAGFEMHAHDVFPRMNE